MSGEEHVQELVAAAALFIYFCISLSCRMTTAPARMRFSWTISHRKLKQPVSSVPRAAFAV